MRNAQNTGNWTDERVEQLKKLWDSGMSCAWIAAELGDVSRNAVIGKVHRLGLVARADRNSSRAAGQKVSRRDRRVRWRQSRIICDQQFIEPPKAPDHLGLTFDQLKPGMVQCRYIHGDNQETPFTYCGQPVEAGKSFCGFHQRLCYHKVDTKARKPFIPARGVA